MIDKIAANQFSSVPELNGSRTRPSADPGPGKRLEVSLEISDAALIDKAKQPSEDEQQLQKAKELLQSGRLDTPANIREAAKNLLRFGV